MLLFHVKTMISKMCSSGTEQLVSLLNTVYHHESTVWPKFIIVKTEFACNDFKVHLAAFFFMKRCFIFTETAS